MTGLQGIAGEHDVMEKGVDAYRESWEWPG
jgi:hypothetical protein